MDYDNLVVDAMIMMSYILILIELMKENVLYNRLHIRVC